MAGQRGHIPLAVKVPYTLFLCALVPTYWRGHGAANFLWFCDIALITLLLAMWLESALLASMTAVGVLWTSIGWNLDFFTGATLLGMVGYMFDPAVPLHLRAMSLFHVALPVLPLWMVHRLGYDRRAFAAQSVLMALVLLATYLLSDPAVNINWTFGLDRPQDVMHPLVYLLLLALGVALLICLPAHLLLQLVFDREAPAQEGWREHSWNKEN
ncbi:MAG: membrane-associated protein [Gammaproteobacteria bacterium]|nr:membrane-associated protein [Gammaproteobacteria bacterium]